jgi:hypothetical protein
MPRRGETTHTRGYLPHIVKPGATYFVTFRLADSLPREVLAKLEAELQTCSADIPICQSSHSSPPPSTAQHKPDLDRERRKQIESFLDRCAERNDIHILPAAAAIASLKHFKNASNGLFIGTARLTSLPMLSKPDKAYLRKVWGIRVSSSPESSILIRIACRFIKNFFSSPGAKTGVAFSSGSLSFAYSWKCRRTQSQPVARNSSNGI